MKKWKSIIGLAMAAALSICGLSACGGSKASETTEAPKTAETAEKVVRGTEIDFFDAIDVMFFDPDGKGYISIGCNTDGIEYDKENAELTEFLESVEVDCDKKKKLSNGDEVLLSLKYSDEEAEKLDVSFKEASRTYTVYGLPGEKAVTSMDEVKYDEIAEALKNELREGEELVSVYCIYKENEENASRYVYELDFIVTDGSHYYPYQIGISPDGSKAGNFVRNIGRYRIVNSDSEEKVLEKLADTWGEENIEKVE